MKRYTADELAEVLRKHLAWLRDEDGGECANLDGANLRCANLRCANLDGANLDGANLEGANLDGAKNFKSFVAIGPLGSRRGYTFVHLQEDVIRCGCFTGTLAEFEAAVRRTHADNPVHLGSYLALCAMVPGLRAAQPLAREIPPPAYTAGARVRLTAEGAEKWPWAPKDEAGRVHQSSDGWTRVDFLSLFFYLDVPDAWLERVEGGAE